MTRADGVRSSRAIRSGSTKTICRPSEHTTSASVLDVSAVKTPKWSSSSSSERAGQHKGAESLQALAEARLLRELAEGGLVEGLAGLHATPDETPLVGVQLCLLIASCMSSHPRSSTSPTSATRCIRRW